MHTMGTRFFTAGVLFLIIFFFGFWLSRTGKPYNSLLLNVHKLIGLAAGILLVVTVYRVHQTDPISPVGLSAAVITVVFFLSLIVTGGLVSAGVQLPGLVSYVHKLFPYLTVLSSAVTIYLLS